MSGLGLGLGLGLFRGERLRIEGRTRPATSRESTLRRRSFISAPAHSSSCLHRAVGSWCEVVLGGRLPICSQPRWLVRALALPQAGTGGEKPSSSKAAALASTSALQRRLVDANVPCGGVSNRDQTSGLNPSRRRNDFARPLLLVSRRCCTLHRRC